MKLLKLNKPLVFFDIEATGLDIIKDKIIEISILKINNSKNKKINTFRINPGIPIPKESSEIHGIFDNDIKNCPKFSEFGQKIKSIINNCDLAGFNILKFDLPILIEEFNNCNIKFSTKNLNIIDVQKIFHLMEKRNLSSAYKFYCKKILKNHHNSYNDTLASYEIFIRQVNKYNKKEVVDLRGNKIGKITNDINKISNTLNKNMVDFQGRLINNNGTVFFNFGKYKGKAVKEILKSNPEYYKWIIKGSFSRNTKDKLEEIYKKILHKSNNNS